GRQGARRRVVVALAEQAEPPRQLGDGRRRLRARGHSADQEQAHQRGTPHALKLPRVASTQATARPGGPKTCYKEAAMGSVNKVILIGNLGADPELKYTPSSRPLCNLRIATTEAFKDKSGQRQERTEWHRVTVWGDQAENCSKYLSKGRSVYVEGKLQTRSYEKEGQKHWATDVVAARVVFLGSGGGAGAGGGEGRRGGGGGGGMGGGRSG